MSQNLITLLDVCNTSSRRIWRNTKQHSKGQGWLKTSRDIRSKYHETLETFPRIRELMESSQPENKTLLRVSPVHSGTL